jgi:hypothetical protein
MKYLLMLVLLTNVSFAGETIPMDRMGELVEKEINSSKGLFNKPGILLNWELKTIRLRVKPSVAVSIPWLAKAKIEPEIELFYNR